MEKTTFYVSISNMSCSVHPDTACAQFIVKLEPHKVRVFEQLFRQLNRLEPSSALRAQIPYLPYHLDQNNDETDLRLKKIYALIHEYGDENTKRFVEQLPYFS